MLKKLLKKAVSIVLVFAMLMEISAPWTYAAELDEVGTSEEQEYLNYGSETSFDLDTASLFNSTNEKDVVLKASDETEGFRYYV